MNRLYEYLRTEDAGVITCIEKLDSHVPYLIFQWEHFKLTLADFIDHNKKKVGAIE